LGTRYADPDSGRSRSGRGLLIVNADDLGYDAETSDAILASFSVGAITSATAMVFMEDSERAAPLALHSGLPTGLHLNLLEPFSGDVASETVRADHEAVCRHFASGARRWFYDPRIREPLARTIRHQLEEFMRLYDRPPTHFDGHQHMHLSLNVLLEPGPLAGLPARRSFSFARGQKSMPNRAWRGATSALIRRRFGSTRRFHSIRDLAPELGGAGLEGALASARATSVEVMTHPGWGDEFELLRSDRWREALDGLPLGSYADLP
jgi:predicted glycoside hydrolase/deacetylase ChbG (UPF0249 family)